MLPNGNISLVHFHPYGFTLYIIARSSGKSHRNRLYIRRCGCRRAPHPSGLRPATFPQGEGFGRGGFRRQRRGNRRGSAQRLRSRRRLCRPVDAAYPLRIKQHARKQAQRQIRLPPRPPTQGRYAGTSLFDHRGMAQGRRGSRHPPDRFARPPSHEQADPPQRVRLFVSALFLLDRPRPVLFLAHPKREWGAGFPCLTCGSSSPWPPRSSPGS